MGQDVLVLNASNELLNVASLRRAIKLIFKGKAEVLEEYRGIVLRYGQGFMECPSVIRMRYYIVRPYRQAPLNRKNILQRDWFTCQYCGKPGRTVDHVQPRSRGGKFEWDNLVCACARCNFQKKNRTPGEASMKLLSMPERPRYIFGILADVSRKGRNWEKYLQH